MKVLLIKTSSLGDLIHTLPALTDAMKAIPSIEFTWCAEESFAEIPLWHPAVKKVIPIAWRRWRKSLLQSWQEKKLQAFYEQIHMHTYDAIIDAQGLLKSAVLTKLAKGPSHGYDKHSIREPLASYFYDNRYAITTEQHAVLRSRKLFSQALNYSLPEDTADFALQSQRASISIPSQDNVLLLHGTSKVEKEWPVDKWIEVVQQLKIRQMDALLPWGNERELERAKSIVNKAGHGRVLPKLSLTQMKEVVECATGVIAVDTGIGHLASAMSKPMIGLYGPTDASKVCIEDPNTQHVDMNMMTPENVMTQLREIMNRHE